MRIEYVPWLASNIIQEMNHRDFLKNKAVLSKLDTYFSVYKTRGNHVNYLVTGSGIKDIEKKLNIELDSLPKRLLANYFR